MSEKIISRLLIFLALLILPLTSCRGGETPSLVKDTETSMPFPFPSQVTSSKTSSLTKAETGTSTSTISPMGYSLKEWREPTEMITPFNLDRVEKIGILEISDNVSYFVWPPDGSRLAVSLLGPLFVIDAKEFSMQWLLSGYLAAFSYTGEILENGGSQYNLLTGERIGSVENETLRRYPGSLLDIEFSPNGEYIAAVGIEFAQIYPMENSIERGIFGRYAATAFHASVSLDSKIVAINYAFEDFTELWNPYSRKPENILKIRDIAGQGKPRFSQNGTSLFFTGNGNWEGREVTFLQEWDYTTSNPISILAIPGFSMQKGFSMDISPNDTISALGTIDGIIHLISVNECNMINLEANPFSGGPINIVAFRPDGRLIATVGYSDNTILLWGIPASETNLETIVPTEKNNSSPISCFGIPMEIENPVPQNDWFGGDRSYQP